VFPFWGRPFLIKKLTRLDGTGRKDIYMKRDNKNSEISQDKIGDSSHFDIGAQIEQEFQEYAKKEGKKPKHFAGFTVKAPIQVYEQIIHEMQSIKNDTAFRCLLFIARQTIGYKSESGYKDFDHISISQFEKGMGEYFKGIGKTRKHIPAALRWLKKFGYICKKIICPHCYRPIKQIEKEIKGASYVRNGRIIERPPGKRKQVPARCPHCHEQLLGKELVFYGLKFRPDALSVNDIKDKDKRTLGGECPKDTQGGVSLGHSQESSKPRIKNHHPSQEEAAKTQQDGASQVGNDDDDKTKKPSEEKTSQSQAKDQGRSSHNQNARDAHILTDEAERVVKKFRQAFGQRRGLKKCAGELNEMVEIFGEQAFLDEIEKVVELEIKPSSMKYIMTCVMRKWDGACPRCSGLGMNNTTPDGKCPLCRGQRHFSEYSELKRARSKMAK